MIKNPYFKFTLFIILSNFYLQASYGDYDNWDQVDYLVANDLSKWAAFFKQPKTKTVRIAMFGDSQESKEGSDSGYVSHINAQFAKVYKNTPETPIMTLGNGQPLFISRMGGRNSANNARNLTIEEHLPGHRSHKGYRTSIVGNKSTGGDTVALSGPTLGLFPTAASMLNSSKGSYDVLKEVVGKMEYFKRDGWIRAEVIGLTHPNSGGLHYRLRYHDKNVVYTNGKIFAEGVLDLNLKSAKKEYKSGFTPYITFPEGNYNYELEINSATTNVPADLVGMRFINETHTNGLVVSEFSMPGEAAVNLLDKYTNSGAMFRAMGFNAAMIHFGTNDGNDPKRTAFNYKRNITDLIARIRQWQGDPNFKVIIMVDVDNGTNRNAVGYANYNQYAGAMKELAWEDDNVLVLNSRRLAAEKLGWSRTATPSKLNEWTTDGVHYRTRGAEALAWVEVETLHSLTDNIPVLDKPTPPVVTPPADKPIPTVATPIPTVTTPIQTIDTTEQTANKPTPPVIDKPETNIGRERLYLDGRDDWVNIPDMEFKGDFTIEAWVKLAAGIGADDSLVGQEGSGPDINFFQGKARLFGGRSSGDVVTAKTLMPVNEWIHVAITRSGSLLTLYLNGKQDANGAWVGKFPVKALGRGNRHTGKFKGELDEVRFWDVARNREQIGQYYNQSLPAGKQLGLVAAWSFDEAKDIQKVSDASGQGRHATLGANASVGKDDPIKVTGSTP